CRRHARRGGGPARAAGRRAREAGFDEVSMTPPLAGAARFFEGVRAQRRAVLFGFGVLIVLGAWAGVRAPAAILPEVVFPRITVIADAGELPAEQMLRAVTRPLETSVRRVPGVRELRSTTARGSVEMNIDCTWQTPMDLTLQRVQASLEAVRGSLPP